MSYSIFLFFHQNAKNIATYILAPSIFVTGDLWRLLTEYANTLKAYDSKKLTDLYSFIYSQFQTKRASRQQENSNCNELTNSCKEAAELLYADLVKGPSQDSEDIT